MDTTLVNSTSYIFSGLLFALFALVTYDRLPVIVKEFSSRAEDVKVGLMLDKRRTSTDESHIGQN